MSSTSDADAISSRLHLLGALDQLQELSETLAAAGISWVLVKGAGLALWVWPDPFARRFSDLDIFVRPRDFGAAVAVLMEKGYVPVPPDEDLSMHWTLRRENVLPVELHHDFTREWTTPRPLLDAFVGEAIAIDGGGFSLPLPAPGRHLGFVLLHAYNHGWMLDAGWLEDVHRILERVPEALSEARAFFPRSWPVELSLAVAAALDARIDAGALPAHIRQAGQALARVCRLRPAVPEPVLSAFLRVAGSPHRVETLARMAARFDVQKSPIARTFRGKSQTDG